MCEMARGRVEQLKGDISIVVERRNTILMMDVWSMRSWTTWLLLWSSGKVNIPDLFAGLIVKDLPGRH